VARVSDATVRLLGWRSLLVHGDPCVLDRWLWVRRYLRPGPVRTFDAGFGNGAFSVYAARAGNEVVAASFSAKEQADAQRRTEELGVTGIDVRLLDLRELDDHRDSLGTFDQIICLETIEHVLDDERLVRALAAILDPGGQLLLSSPFDGHRPQYSEQVNPSPVEDGSHVRYGYSQARLRELVQGAGLTVSGEAFVSGFISQKVTNLMRRLTARMGLLPAWLIVLPLRALVVIDEPLTKLLGYPHLCVAVRAYKPPPAA
jgi:2-polyprenyl-3-methyl-5-hydroxy-6-metoxy-1,4-benzoquinol methylase